MRRRRGRRKLAAKLYRMELCRDLYCGTAHSDAPDIQQQVRRTVYIGTLYALGIQPQRPKDPRRPARA